MTAPLPPSSKTRAWVCAPGVLKVPFLSAFLPDYDLSALPGAQTEAVLGWGMKPTAAAGRRWAQKNGRPYVALEDGFLRSVGGAERALHFVFLGLVVLNLVAGFQALGTLMAVGLMMLPATAARFWAREVWSLAATATAIALVSGAGGLLLSYHLQLPSGPAIVLLAGAAYLVSLAAGRHDSLLARRSARHAHRVA